ncbi:HAD hydrolase-like protein [Halalkalibacterium ligniniphilum]|uniref:HAD hydrolase-like protein n=1 Tax=Halalkalibacterium ligniniphilum TaxID=1134413 RepID=UPI00034DB44A|nr:HAD hydrolase-like protein [Halalkalibacterium ligniniphilum]
MKRAIIFDMDGTLFQTNMILELSLNDAFDHLRNKKMWFSETPIKEYRKIMGVPLPKVWETLLPDFSSEVRNEMDSVFLESLIINIRAGKGMLYPNTIETLVYLKKKKYKIFIASNGLVNYLNTIVDTYKLNSIIDETFSIEQIESYNKSDLVNHIKEKYEISEGAVVGDRISDIKAASDNNLISIGCKFDFSNEEELAHAEIVISDLIELKNIFK